MKNKDPNYVAKVERAIAEKYGVETIQNPRGNWDEEKEKEYEEQLRALAIKEDRLREKEEKIDVGGILISKKLLSREPAKSCPVCRRYSLNLKDDVYMNKYECCLDCFVQFVEGREERWKKGWRPQENG